MTEIKVEKLRKVEGRGSLRAFVDLRIGRTLFRSWRVVQQEGQRPWVSPPVESWEDRDGKRHYRRLVEFPDELKRRVDEAVLKAYNEETE